MFSKLKKEHFLKPNLHQDIVIIFLLDSSVTRSVYILYMGDLWGIRLCVLSCP
jgi:hypothetical protein